MFDQAIAEAIRSFMRANVIWITIISTALVLVLTDLHPLIVFAIALAVYFLVTSLISEKTERVEAG